ncbi:discoidin domain-containing protein [Sunxiuqinia dokdonensis]|uniref:F5/8 type C domain-containing protein n=1 Tax=Sunxiuqinia dokdonensis TaxID=1409788 RepID=A0A0L8VF37_9BACT|nr:discoidin domain-containing protein [Sunxiuqinia dokdonensis]KOH46772.1 hypothetical protein NC99_04140 [Sunxiuqinia dokdonensis]
MKKTLIYTLGLAALSLGLSSCEEDYQAIEYPEAVSSIPAPISNIVSTSLPGQIALNWDLPESTDYYYMQVSYFDHLMEKEVVRVASSYADSMLIDNTRAKFGEYEFRFQTFSLANVGSEITTVTAVSEKAPATVTISSSKVNLTADQLSTNNQEPSEGPIANLVDGDAGSFFHTRWSSPQIPMPQYIQVDLAEPIQAFQFYFQNRAWSQVGAEIVEIQISNDGENWETLTTIDGGLPSGGGAEYTSEIFEPENSFTFFRYNVLQTYGSRNYFNMAEFALFDVDIQTYDPEL